MSARIRALNRLRRSAPARLRPRSQALEQVRVVLCDVYGTMLDSAADPLRNSPGRTVRRRMKSVLAQAGLTPRCPRAPALILNVWQQRLQQAQRLSRARGIEYPEVDIRRVWGKALRLGVQKGWIKGRIDARVIARIALEFEGVQNPVALMPGVKAALEQLRRRGIRLGIVSNAQFYTPWILQVLLGKSLSKAGFDRQLCVWSYRLGRAKPSEYLLKLALKRIRQKYGLTPRQVLVIGNAWHNDIAPAQRCGCRTALMAASARAFRYPPGMAQDRQPDLLLTGWSQLSAARSVARR
ncbi:MAG: HAD family hydrolase [Lentisphaerae bacterium]|nr:HAD family hydrolase [Lentisphaerota bacterium]